MFYIRDSERLTMRQITDNFDEYNPIDCSVQYIEDINDGEPFVERGSRVRVNYGPEESILNELELRIPKDSAQLKQTLRNVDPESVEAYTFYIDYQAGGKYTERPTLIFYKTDNGDYIPFILGSGSGVAILDGGFHKVFLRSTSKVDRNIILNFLYQARWELVEYAHTEKEQQRTKSKYHTKQAYEERLTQKALLFNLNRCNKRQPAYVIYKREDTVEKIVDAILSGDYVYDPFDIESQEDWDRAVALLKVKYEEARKAKASKGYYYSKKYSDPKYVHLLDDINSIEDLY